MNKTSLSQFVAKRPHLVWYVDKNGELSSDAVVEAVFNYGDWDDVKELIRILGMKQTAAIFKKRSTQQRSNYRPRTSHFFTLYFKKHLNKNT